MFHKLLAEILICLVGRPNFISYLKYKIKAKPIVKKNRKPNMSTFSSFHSKSSVFFLLLSAPLFFAKIIQ